MDLTRMRMAQYYLVYARQHQAEFAVLDEEWINLMSGMEAAHGLEMWRVTLDYAEGLQGAGFALGHFSDIRRCAAWAIDAAQAQNDLQAQAANWRSWGRACIEQADYDEAHTHLTRSLATSSQLGDLAKVAGAQFDLARIAIERAEYADARRLLADSQRLLEALRDERGLAEIHFRQAAVAFYEREFDEADRLAQQALGSQETLNDKAGGILTLRLLADIALHGQADFARAEHYCAQSLIWCDEVQNESERAAVLYTLAEVHRMQGQIDLAHAEAGSCLQLFKRMGDRKSQAHALYRLSQLEADRGEWESARHNGVLGLALCRQLQDKWGTVYLTHHLGQVYEQLGQIDEARALWAEALALAEPLAHPLRDTLRTGLKTQSPG
jgi:tetratricopeptide (TPR) repeat protein